ncbi:hypothetical protein VKS41_000235 [Umbelopsis sp. WA50703]
MTQTTPAVLDPQSLFVLGTIGTISLGTLAWLARNHLFTSSNTKSRSQNQTDSAKKQASAPPKKSRNFVEVMEKQNRSVIVFYGSQTGTAEEYAARIAKEASQKYNVSAMTADMEEYDMEHLSQLPSHKLAIFVLATYGEGEPTDNAVQFWDMITQEETPEFAESDLSDVPGKPLKNLRYIAFGLGNKTYEHFNEAIRVVDKKLTEYGATRIGECGEGDDDGSLEEDFMSWQETMWPVFCETMQVSESSIGQAERTATFQAQELKDAPLGNLYLGELGDRSQQNYDAKKPYPAHLQSRDLFTNSDRHCLHLDIDTKGSGLKYVTGDHIAIWPTNSETEVSRLVNALGLTDKLDVAVQVDAIDPAAPKKHPFPVPSTYRAIFRHYLDIATPPTRPVLGLIASFAPSDESKQYLEKLSTDKEAYKADIIDACVNLGQLLESLDSTPGAFGKIPFDVIVEIFTRLQPRYYSISSSALESPDVISVTAVTLKYNPATKPERTVYGVATNYLWALHQSCHPESKIEETFPEYNVKGPRDTYLTEDGAKAPVHVRKSNFKLPRNPTVPIILVGPGTGVAPHRAFVRERAWQKRHGKDVGKTVLFFGCRRSDEDYLYKNEWPELFETLGGESRIITAFSRETDQKVYVQHRLRECGEEMWKMISEQGAYIYVCGDAKRMAKDVQSAFIEFAQTYGDRSAQDAEQYVKDLRTKGRYQEDVWA